MEKKKINNAPIVLLLILMYVIVAMSDNFKGVFVPFFKGEFGVSNTEVGYVMTASLFAYAVFQYVGGILIEKFGYKKIIGLGYVIGILSLVVLVNCRNFPMLILGMFLLNMGMAMFNIGVNTLGPVLTVASTIVLMSVINCAYGAGNTVLQMVCGQLLARGIPWRMFYVFMLICVVALFVYLLVIKIPYKPVEQEVKGNKKDLFKNVTLWLYIGACGFYLASEYNVGNWFVNYMNESFQLASDQSAFYVTLFVGIRTVGLLFGGFVAEKLGYFKTMILYGCLGSAVTFAGIAMGRSGLIVFGISGFFFAAIFPSIITTIGKVFKGNTSYASGLILMCGTLIAMVISFLIGVLNDVIGARYGFFMVSISLMLCTVFCVIIKNAVKGKM